MAVMSRGVVVRGDRADRGIAHAVEKIVVRDAPLGKQADAALVETALDELLHELRTNAGRHEYEKSVRLCVGDFLEKGRKVRVSKGDAQVLHLAACLGEGLGERL